MKQTKWKGSINCLHTTTFALEGVPKSIKLMKEPIYQSIKGRERGEINGAFPNRTATVMSLPK